MRTPFICGLLVIVTSWLIAPVWGQGAPAMQIWNAEPPLLHYSTIDGMSQGDVLGITQDTSGYLWVATHRGLNRYDGHEFRTFTKADGLAHNNVTALYAATDGRIWLTDINGTLSVIERAAVTEILPIPDLASTSINDITEFQDRIILSTESKGLFAIASDLPDATVVAIRESEEPTYDLIVHEGSLWFVQKEGLYRWSGLPTDTPILERRGVLHAAKRNESSFWVATKTHILKQSGSEFEQAYALPDAVEVTQMVSGPDDTVWLSTKDGYYRYPAPAIAGGSDSMAPYFEPFRLTTTLFVDRENTLWLGRYGGLYRHLGYRFEHFKNRLTKHQTVIWAIAEDEQGNFYFASNEGLLRRAPSGETVDFSKLAGAPAGEYRDIVVGADGKLYAGSLEFGVYAIDVANPVATKLDGTDNIIVLDLELDGRGWLWVATELDGLIRLDPSGAGAPRRFEVTQEGMIYTVEADPVGNIWYGADNIGLGLLEFDDGDSVTHTMHGAELGLDKMLFSHIVAVGVGQIWAAGEDSRLMYFDNGEVTDYTRMSPMRDQNIYSVFVQGDKSLLLGGERGVFTFNVDTGRSHGYGLLHGFQGLEVNAHATFLDKAGDLWFGTIDGPTRMDLDLPFVQPMPVQPRIKSVRVQGTSNYVTSGQRVDYDQHDLEIRYDDVSLKHPSGVEYSHRLVGRDWEWSAPSKDRVVNYSSLAPGKYRFETRARYVDGPWFTNPHTVQFSVATPFWQTPLFVLLAIVGVLLLLYLCVWIRTSNIERLNRRLRVEVEERTRSLEEGRVKLLQSNRQLQQESEERRRANEARAEVETRFRVAFQSTPIGMALIDVRGVVLNSNRALREMFLAPALHPEDTAQVNAQVNALSFVNDDEKHSMWSDFERLKKGEIDRIETEYRCKRYDGDVLHARVFWTAVRDHEERYKYCIAQVQDITESRRLTDALEYQANYDELSGLLNRRSFENELSRAYAQSRCTKTTSYLMFMDLDQFKVVNDTSGHSAGDELLRQISAVIREQVRNDDTLGRLGGDEFGLILWNCPTDVAYRIAESIRSAVEEFQFQWLANTYRVGVSIGAVLIDQHLGSVAELQQLADAACYHSKDNGRNRVHFVKGSGESISEQRGEIRWVQRLHEAMDSSNFALYGQFIKPVDPESQEPERMEILLRMREPRTRKIIPPGAFLPAAERYGLVTKLDQWVVENLLRMLYVHQAAGSRHRRYWVNLSGTSVGDKRFVDFLIDAVKTSGLPEGMINFEITETAVIRNVGEAGRLMSALHDEGCQFALDDFGSGLSSFGYLKKLPVDSIKIDGMFVRDILTDDIDHVFVRSIIDISRTMGIKSIAEFVENAKILDAVRDLGVDYVQGFGVHRPEALFADLTSDALLGPSLILPDQSPIALSKEKFA